MIRRSGALASLLLLASACGSAGPGDNPFGSGGQNPTGSDTETSGDASSGDETSGGDDTPGTIDRDEDPVVVLGAQIPGLDAVDATDVVGFVRHGGAWEQIPVQVDERVVQDFCEIYGKSSGLWTDEPPCRTSAAVTALFYADPNTFTGADTDPTFDGDDELVFMARDAGDRAGSGFAPPAGVVEQSAVELELSDDDDRGYVYLFAREDAGLDPGAGADYVSYTFALSGGIDYKTQYDLYGYGCGGETATCDPSMTEDSTIETSNYSHHFAARWVSDELRIHAGDATGVDILDVHQARFSPESCGRHVLTFSTAEGAYVVNKDGPVRALREYLGANSGPLTSRTHRFYDKRQDITTDLRVHALAAGLMDIFDYSDAAIGMTYVNDLHPDGLVIDGEADAADQSALHSWELISGPQGSLVMTEEVESSITPGSHHFYWADEQEASFPQCDTSTILDVPDGSALGSSGSWREGALPDTDPKNGSVEYLRTTRVVYFREPGLAQSDALTLVEGAKAPVGVTARRIDDGGTGPTCGDGTCEAGEEGSCALDCVPIDGSCGDTLCLPPETSTSCPQDCTGGGGGGDEDCGNGTCDAAIENELSCAADCWPEFENAATCVDANCPGALDACADEPGCVDMVTCVATCVGGGGNPQQCISDCVDAHMPSKFESDAADAVLGCASANDCLTP